MSEAGSIKMWVLAFVVLAGIGFGTLVGVGCAIGANACPFVKHKPVTTTDGRTLYLTFCAACHGVSGEGLNGRPALRSGDAATLTLAQLESKISKGRPFFGMPAWSTKLNGPLSDAQIAAVAQYVISLRNKS
jgi:mono/diheme cytochrome c family protein